MKKSGFTLSEVLVALSIVGIVAALTVPNVVSSNQKKAQVLGLKKVFMNLEQNLTALRTEKLRGATLWNTMGKDGAESFLKDNYKIKRDCGNTPSPCFASQYRLLNGDTSGFSNSSGYSVQLSDGSAISLKAPQSEDQWAVVRVDVNGPDKPNIAGRDFFTFNIYKDFSIDAVSQDVASGDKKAARETKFNTCKTSLSSVGCFAKIYNDNWEMNY